ncbi:MAG: DUF2782 domain-containing protein [Gammaproteobacteria bacterium]|nr:DUF2782 domain-containing protein [Gammaproteobacteria bacterium]
MRNARLFSLLIAALFSTGLLAEDKLDAVPDGAPVVDTSPPKIIKGGDADAGPEFEPTITIRESEKGQLEEYSVRGHIYMVKVTPRSGAPYYLIDRDGDGAMESRVSDLQARIQVPAWALSEW